MNKTTSIIIAIVLIAAAFYGGTLYGKSSATAAAAAARAQFAGRAGGGAGGFGGRGGAGGGATMGSILSNANNQLTVQLASGGSEIVFLTGSTTIMKSTTVAPTDLTTGQNILVAGTKNSDGSVTATVIQVRPAMTTTAQ
jgi:hypothetical protein